jgi:hypothetical protein
MHFLPVSALTGSSITESQETIGVLATELSPPVIVPLARIALIVGLRECGSCVQPYLRRSLFLGWFRQ